MMAAVGLQVFIFTKEVRSEDQGTPALSASENAGIGTKNNRQPVRAPRLINDLFGSQAAEQKVEEVKPQENIPETKLKLTLRGVSVSADPQRRTALIEGPDRQTNVYSINQSLPGNATLYEVHNNWVIINRSGALEKVFFPQEADPNAAIIAQTTRDSEPEEEPPVEYNPEEMGIQEETEPEAANENNTAGGISEDRKEEIKRRLKELRERMQLN